ncbi:MAG TPA: hypothetical protein VNR18_12560 [Hyphomicrobiales bacterium]|nr:hypothetical protein [Hyphomicrobiales bacterium]
MNLSKHALLWLLALVSLLDGAVQQLTAPGTLFSVSGALFLVPETLLVFLWYCRDTSERGLRRRPSMNAAVILLPLVALPYHFFRTRGFAQGLKPVGGFVACLLGYLLLMDLGAYAAYFVLQN